jgi:hypothetical protein
MADQADHRDDDEVFAVLAKLKPEMEEVHELITQKLLGIQALLSDVTNDSPRDEIKEVGDSTRAMLDELKFLYERKGFLGRYATSFPLFARALALNKKQDTSGGEFLYRSQYTRLFGFPVVTRPLVQEIVQDLVFPLVSVFSGLAFLEAAIEHEYKVKFQEAPTMRCSDLCGDCDVNPAFRGSKCFTKVIAQDALQAIEEAVELYRETGFSLMMSWPPMHESVAAQALQKFVELAPLESQFFYWGETEQGCCASEQFFDILRCNFKLVKTYNNHRWFGIHDSVLLFRLQNKGDTCQ